MEFLHWSWLRQGINAFLLSLRGADRPHSQRACIPDFRTIRCPRCSSEYSDCSNCWWHGHDCPGYWARKQTSCRSCDTRPHRWPSEKFRFCRRMGFIEGEILSEFIPINCIFVSSWYLHLGSRWSWQTPNADIRSRTCLFVQHIAKRATDMSFHRYYDRIHWITYNRTAKTWKTKTFRASHVNYVR